MIDEIRTLPPGCILRPASSKDIWPLWKLVLGAKLEPTQLQSSNFWVIECEKKVIACGQLRSFPEAQELGSLVVVPAWRGKGLGSYLVEHLIQQATLPLYLECAAKLMPFYLRLGFVQIPWRSLPQSLKIKFGLTQTASIFLPIRLRIMKYKD